MKKRRGYATGGMVYKGTRTDAWIDQLPIDKQDQATRGDPKLAVKPPPTSDDIVTGPQPRPSYMENSKGGKVKKVIPVRKGR